MTPARIKRAARLIELRQRAVDLAQAELAAATRKAAEDAAQARAAHDAWEGYAARLGEGCDSSGELADAHAYLQTLRLRVERARAAAEAARAEQERKREQLAAAKGELRKLELWRDGLAAAQGARVAREERAATDDVAARMARGER